MFGRIDEHAAIYWLLCATDLLDEWFLLGEEQKKGVQFDSCINLCFKQMGIVRIINEHAAYE